jgi:hypothetical protein
MYYIIILDMLPEILCSSSGGSECIVTASGIVTLRKQLFSAPVQSGLQFALNRCTEWLSDDTRCRNNTI